ncbi:cytochrome P450 [Sphaerisporangium sp. TRM90804]|uniref:cytochrome P450 n=1 Tax=Sphaerisporangium sp. TRM90804 TaxID=3031113 RepID=UPI0024495727|nr:cytochrome P450 [Sphaerisporangium sp. TRM90804]MDH2427279.1 cytochrome P450 [Sphaerisporangium sp. TRM90804]
MNGPDILSPEYDADPYPHYARMRDAYPLYVHEATGFHVLSRYEDVTRALRGHPFTNECYAWQVEPVHGDRTIIQMDGAEHAGHHKMFGPALRGRDLHERVIPSIELAAAELIDRFEEAGEVDLVGDFAKWLPINVMATLLGLPDEDRPRFQRWYTALMARMSNFGQDEEVERAGSAARAELDAYLTPIIHERRDKPGTDLLSSLCAAEHQGEAMSDRQVLAYCSMLLAAGGETAASAISGTMFNLVRHPGQLKAVRADRGLVDRAHVETLRRDSPIQLILRHAAEDVEMAGGVIPAGSSVACVIAAANRDGGRFADPGAFDLFRSEIDPGIDFTAGGAIVTFGRGRHFCLGAMLARAEVGIAVNRLLDAMPDVRLAEDARPVETGVFTRGLVSLPVVFTPRDGGGHGRAATDPAGAGQGIWGER